MWVSNLVGVGVKFTKYTKVDAGHVEMKFF